MKKKKGPMQLWGDKINWARRVRAVCKPCWEIKYCPYGPLVENFPIKKDPDEKSCRIFGHDCPVFYVAEPLTETKELRNISRSIPRVVQFRVMKRENQICSNCGKSVKDGEIEFDHVIPWSKGGSSDENNVTMLCISCNRKKGEKFEDKYLIESLSDHIVEQAPIEILYIFLDLTNYFHKIFLSENRYPTPEDFCKFWGRKKIQRADEFASETVKEMADFFSSPIPKGINKKHFLAMKYRWGFNDRKIHNLEEVSKRFSIAIDNLILTESSLLKRFGYPIKLTNKSRNKWKKSHPLFD